MSYSRLHVLVVDDSKSDIELFKLVAKECAERIDVFAVQSGTQAREDLRGQNGDKNEPRAHLVLLDVNMPGMNGFEVLQRVRDDEKLCCQPVLMLSLSQDQRDVSRAYTLGANSYLTKPQTIDEFCQLLKKLHAYWAEAAVLPGTTVATGTTGP